MSNRDPALDGAIWLRIFELKLPGAGEGAREEPRGAKDIFELERAPPAAEGRNPSLSRLGRKILLAYGRFFWVGVADEPKMLGGPPICPSDRATVNSGGLGIACVLQYGTRFYVNQWYLTTSRLYQLSKHAVLVVYC